LRARSATVAPPAVSENPDDLLFRERLLLHLVRPAIGRTPIDDGGVFQGRVNPCLTPADGYAERVAALHMIEPHEPREADHARGRQRL